MYIVPRGPAPTIVLIFWHQRCILYAGNTAPTCSAGAPPHSSHASGAAVPLVRVAVVFLVHPAVVHGRLAPQQVPVCYLQQNTRSLTLNCVAIQTQGVPQTLSRILVGGGRGTCETGILSCLPWKLRTVTVVCNSRIHVQGFSAYLGSDVLVGGGPSPKNPKFIH